MNTPNLPQFLSIYAERSFRNGPFKAYQYKCKLNGTFVTACECDVERGYADVIEVLDPNPTCLAHMRIHRLFGVVELIAVDDL